MRVPSYRRHSSGQARVTLNGRVYYLGPFGSPESRREYDRLIAEYLASGRQVSYGIPTEQLVISQCLADYLTGAKTYYGTAANSEYPKIVYAMRVVRALYATLPAADFGSMQYKACREKFASEPVVRTPPKKKAKSKPSTAPRLRTRQYVNSQVKRILRFFKWLAAEGKIPAANFESMKLIAGLKAGKCKLPEAKRVLPVDDAVVVATIPHLPPIVADMVRFQRLVGCRPSEVCGLKPCQVDRSKEVWEAHLDEHKTAHHGLSRTRSTSARKLKPSCYLTFYEMPVLFALIRRRASEFGCERSMKQELLL